jgi:8-oxo-dGTP pyrophosphatase MutT (NUDIX family)
MEPKETLDRVAGRVILLDEDGRVLLFQGFDPAEPGNQPWWFTPGGGLEPGETTREAAARELREETGLVIEPEELGEIVFDEYVEFSFDGVLLRQHNDFFMIRTGTFEVSTAGFEEIERRTTLDHRWWSADELRQTTETFYPGELPRLLP